MNKKIISKIIFYIVFGAVPFSLFIVWPGKQLEFESLFGFLFVAGKIAGIIGICFFSGNLILSGRYHFLDRWLEGLDQLYLFHRRTGIYTFSLLAFHVLAIASPNLQFSFTHFYRFIFDIRGLDLNYGRIAFFGMATVVILTLALSGKIKYERLKRMHQFMGVFLFFGGLHAFFIPSDISYNLYLRYYVLMLVAIAIVSYLWRTVLRRWLIPFIICDVVEVNMLNATVTEVVLKPKNVARVHFYPGQFVFIRFLQEKFPNEEHPFSLTASTEEGLLRISAKHIGDFTKILPKLKVGAIAKIQGPYGGFTFVKSKNKKQIWIAGGIGVTPFTSMARTLRDKIKNGELLDYNITLIFSVQTANDFVYKDEFEKIAKENQNFSFIPWVAAEKGYLNIDAIKKITEIDNKKIFICGPKPMMFSIKSQLIKQGMPNSSIHFEIFRLL